MKDYYNILGISRSASNEDIKLAFRRKAKETHPDMHDGSEYYDDIFKNVVEAYSVLSNPAKRAEYDAAINNENASTCYDNGDTIHFSSQNEIYKYINRMMASVKLEALKAKEKATASLIKGILWLVLGIGITVWTYVMAIRNGGYVFVLYGAIIGGGILAVRSFIAYSRINRAVAEFQKAAWESVILNASKIFDNDVSFSEHETTEEADDKSDINGAFETESENLQKNTMSDNSDLNIEYMESQKKEGGVLAAGIIAIFVLILILFVTLANPSFGTLYGTWKYNQKGSWYEFADGSYPKNEIYIIDGIEYGFDKSGYMCKGWAKIYNRWYYFDKSGRLIKAKWIDNCYYVEDSGVMVTSAFIKSGENYHMVDQTGSYCGTTNSAKDTQGYKVYDEKTGAVIQAGYH